MHCNQIFYKYFVIIYSELCALVNKTSGASASVSDLKYYRRYRER